MSKKLIVSLPFIIAGVIGISDLIRRHYHTEGLDAIDKILACRSSEDLQKVAVARFCRFRRCSARACPFSTAWTSPRRRQAMPLSKARSHRCAGVSSEERRFRSR
jgi:hypothetical protein